MGAKHLVLLRDYSWIYTSESLIPHRGSKVYMCEQNQTRVSSIYGKCLNFCAISLPGWQATNFENRLVLWKYNFPCPCEG